jgi:hypothetical protein
MGEGVGQMLRGGGYASIWVLEVSNVVTPGSFEDGLVEEGSISITFDSPTFFVSLSMENFLLSENDMVLMD